MRKDYILVDLNFCKHPLAREPRSVQKWSVNSRGRRWLDLTTDVRLRTYMIKARAPSGFDMKVLFDLLSMRRRLNGFDEGDRPLEFETLTELMEALNLQVRPLQGSVIATMHDSLDLWSQLGIVWSNFWCFKENGPIQLNLDPPIAWVKTGRRYVIHFSQNWSRFYMGSRFVARIPRPLPTQSHVQNTILNLIAWKGRMRDPKSRRMTVNPELFMDQVGLNHAHRRRIFQGPLPSWINSHKGTILDQTALWFQQHGGDLQIDEITGFDKSQMGLTLVLPRSMREGRSKRGR